MAKTQPHAAYAAFIHGYVHKFSYLCSIDQLLQPLEDCICSQLIPALNGKRLALPVRLSSLGIVNPTKVSSLELLASANISASLRELILKQSHEYSMDCLEAQINAKKDTHK